MLCVWSVRFFVKATFEIYYTCCQVPRYIGYMHMELSLSIYIYIIMVCVLCPIYYRDFSSMLERSQLRGRGRSLAPSRAKCFFRFVLSCLPWFFYTFFSKRAALPYRYLPSNAKKNENNLMMTVPPSPPPPFLMSLRKRGSEQSAEECAGSLGGRGQSRNIVIFDVNYLVCVLSSLTSLCAGRHACRATRTSVAFIVL